MAGTKTWTDADVVTAADLNGFVRDQWVTICTSGTRPSTTQTGRLIYEADTRRTLLWDGTAWAIVREDQWTAYTPTWTAATTNPTNGILAGRWRYTGPKTIDMDVQLTTQASPATTFGAGVWRFSLPGGFSSSALRLQTGTWFTGTGPRVGVAYTGGGTFVELVGESYYVGPTTPHTWTTAGQQLYVSMRGLELA